MIQEIHCSTVFFSMPSSSLHSATLESVLLSHYTHTPTKHIYFSLIYVGFAASCTMGTGSFLGVRCSWVVMLTPHPLPLLRSKIG